MEARVDKTERWCGRMEVYTPELRARAAARHAREKKERAREEKERARRAEEERRAAIAARWREVLDRRAEMLAEARRKAAEVEAQCAEMQGRFEAASAAEAATAAPAARTPTREERREARRLALKAERARLAAEMALKAAERAAVPRPAFPPVVFVRYAAAFYDLSIADMRSPHRAVAVSKPRHVIIAACALAYPDLSLPRLGQIFNRDHTSILHALRATGFYTARGAVRAACADVTDPHACLVAIVANARAMGREFPLPAPPD